MITHSWFAAIMKLFLWVGASMVGGALASCGEREETSSRPGDQIPPLPGRDSVKIETHDAKPEEGLKMIMQSSNKGIINWNDFSVSGEEQFVTPGPDSETIMKVPGKLSDYERLPEVSGGGRVIFVDEEGNAMEADP